MFLPTVQVGNDGKGLKLGKKWKGQTFQVCTRRKFCFLFFADLVCVVKELISEIYSKKVAGFLALKINEFQLKTGTFWGRKHASFCGKKVLFKISDDFSLPNCLLHTYVTNKARNKFSCPIHLKWLLMPQSEKLVEIKIGIVLVIFILCLICNWQDCIFAA